MKTIRQIWICIAALFAVVLPLYAHAEQEDPMRYVRLSGTVCSFTYTAPANGDYLVYVWSADGEPVSAQISVESKGVELASGIGRGAVCSARLAAEREYCVNVQGTGYAAVEIARNALSRCFDEALDVEENSVKGKMIARSGDAHWYAFTASSDSFLLLTCEPEETDLDLGALLMDDAGNLVAEFETLPGGACILRAVTESGRRYYVRVHSPKGRTGYYNFSTHRMQEGELSNSPLFDSYRYSISRNHVFDLRAHLSGNVYLYTSSDPEVCNVASDGTVVGLREGKAIITAYGFAAQAKCEITVVNVPIDDIRFLGERIRLYAGDDTDAPIVVEPENASSGLVIYTVEDSRIASVTNAGIVTGLAPGTTVLHAATRDGNISDTIEVVVEAAPARYRALLIGEENYPASVNDVRPGTKDALTAMAAMLDTMAYGDEKCITTTASDLSRQELVRSIRETFAGNADKDISIIYISCHGEYVSGRSYLQLTDGVMMPAQVLESELREIRGKVVLMLDCCASGGAIGAGTGPALFTEGIQEAFSSNVFSQSKYLVLCSTELNRQSYRIYLDRNGETMMVTAFVKALCDAGGWDPSVGAGASLPADMDMDGSVTFSELADYTRKRVHAYMSNAQRESGNRYIQNVMTNSPSSPLVLFER